MKRAEPLLASEPRPCQAKRRKGYEGEGSGGEKGCGEREGKGVDVEERKRAECATSTFCSTKGGQRARPKVASKEAEAWKPRFVLSYFILSTS